VTALSVDFEGLPDDVRVGLARAGAEADALAALSEEERARMGTFGHADRRRSFALGRLAARTLLADALGAPAQEVPLGVATAGAPEVPGHALYLSISHAGRGAGLAAAAAVGGRPVGVDLETAGPRHVDLLARILGPGESGIAGALGTSPADAPALVWALKEAVLKGLGTGLRRGARSVVLEPRAAGVVAAHDGADEWTVRFDRAGPFWLAVAWR